MRNFLLSHCLVLWAHSLLMSNVSSLPLLCEFLGYWDWLWYHGLPAMLVRIALSHSSELGAFPFTLLHLPLDFIPNSSLRPTYLHHSVDPSLTILGEFSGLCIRCCGPRGGVGVHMKQKSRSKFLPWPGFEPRNLVFQKPGMLPLDYRAMFYAWYNLHK